MSNLNSIEAKLIRIKKAIGNNGIESINIWVTEDEPIRFDLLYKNNVKRIYCNDMEEYEKLIKKYDNVHKRIFFGVRKPKPGDVKIAE